MGTTMASSSDDGEISSLPLVNRPEGVAQGSMGSIYVSQVLTGGISEVYPESGAEKVRVNGQEGRRALGIETYKNAIVVAGGGSALGIDGPALFAYDRTTGEELASCAPSTAVFINDVAIIGKYAYFTCSAAPLVIKVNAERLLNGECEMESIPIPEQFADDFTGNPDEGMIAANGVASMGRGLVIVTTNTGSAFYFQPESGYIMKLVDGEVVGADGIDIYGRHMYIAAGTNIYKYKLTSREKGAELSSVVTDDLWENLASVVVSDGKLFAADLTPLSVPVFSEFVDGFDGNFNLHVIDL